MRLTTFACGPFYHVYNRGNDKRPIFTSDEDRCRFLGSMLHFNQEKHTRPYSPLGRQWYTPMKSEDPIVRIVAYCLMDTHFHLLLEQQKMDGISTFMKRLAQGYTHYYNRKHERSGRLFSSAYHAKIIEDDAHFSHIGRYIHMNPLAIDQPGWDEHGHLDAARADRFLGWYPWSSYLHYAGKVCDPVVGSRPHDPPLGHEDNRKTIREWFQHREKYPKIPA